MTNLRLVTRSACALSAAILATTALQSTPAEAREKGSGRTDSSAHVKVKQGHSVPPGFHGGKQPHAVPSGFHGGGKQVTSSVGGIRATSSNGTRQPGDGGGLTAVGSSIPLPGGIKTANSSAGQGGTKATSSSSSGNGGTRPSLGSGGELIPIPAQPQSGGNQATASSQSGGRLPPILSGTPTPIQPSNPPIANNPGKLPPILSGTPTSTPVPPATGPINPGNLPGSRPPVITATPAPTSTPPATGPINPGNLPGSRPPVLTPTPTPAPIPPVTGPINPGNYPGGSIPPILSGTPTPAPIPVPVPNGSSPSPNPGYGTGYAHRYGQFRVYADVGAVGDGYAPCRWLRSNYDRTGNVYWLNRYNVCLWQH